MMKSILFMAILAVGALSGCNKANQTSSSGLPATTASPAADGAMSGSTSSGTSGGTTTASPVASPSPMASGSGR